MLTERKILHFVIPAKAGIQSPSSPTLFLGYRVILQLKDKRPTPGYGASVMTGGCNVTLMKATWEGKGEGRTYISTAVESISSKNSRL